MNIVDSSGWLEYFAKGPNARKFQKPLTETANLIVPVITIYEVFRVVLRERGENDALMAAAAMQKAKVFILTGQSNMEGKSLAHHLDTYKDDPLIKDTYASLKDGDGWAMLEMCK